MQGWGCSSSTCPPAGPSFSLPPLATSSIQRDAEFGDYRPKGPQRPSQPPARGLVSPQRSVPEEACTDQVLPVQNCSSLKPGSTRAKPGTSQRALHPAPPCKTGSPPASCHARLHEPRVRIGALATPGLTQRGLDSPHSLAPTPRQPTQGVHARGLSRHGPEAGSRAGPGRGSVVARRGSVGLEPRRRRLVILGRGRKRGG